MTSNTLTFQSGLSHSTGYFLRQVSGIVFCDTFKDCFENDTFRVLGNVLGGRLNLDPILPQPHFENSTVFSVSGKSVEFPDNHILPFTMNAVGDHLLEVDTLLYIFSSRGSSVNIDSYYAVAFSLAVCDTVPKLSFDGLFFLPLRAEPKIQGHIDSTLIESGGVFSKLIYFFLGQHGEVYWEFLSFH